MSPYLDQDGLLLLAVVMANSQTSIIDWVNLGPVGLTARYSIDYSQGLVPLTVHFDASGSACTLGTISSFEWDWEGAMEAFRRAMDIDPSYYSPISAYGCCLLVIGRLDEARRYLVRALETEPFSIVSIHLLVATYIRSGDSEAARDVMRDYLRLFAELPAPHYLKGQLLFLDGDVDGGLASLRRAVDISNHAPAHVSALGWACATSGREREAREMLGELLEQSGTKYVSPYLIAKVYAGLNEVDIAFDCLDRAVQGRDASALWILGDETLENLRGDIRFADVLQRMNLPLRGGDAA
jgi:Flp pilus assembly protein TadD